MKRDSYDTVFLKTPQTNSVCETVYKFSSHQSTYFQVRIHSLHTTLKFYLLGHEASAHSSSISGAARHSPPGEGGSSGAPRRAEGRERRLTRLPSDALRRRLINSSAAAPPRARVADPSVTWLLCCLEILSLSLRLSTPPP